MISNADVPVAAPSLNLTPEEKRVFGQLFRQADTEGVGVVTGEVAVKFFEKTRLEPSILGVVRTFLVAPQAFVFTSHCMFIKRIALTVGFCRYGKLLIRKIEGFLHQRDSV